MAEEKEVVEATSADNDGEISLDDLDSLIEEEDPEFTEEMSGISKDEELLQADVEDLSIEAEIDESEESEKEVEVNFFLKRFPKSAKVFNPIATILSKLKTKISLGFRYIRNRFLLLITTSISYFKNDFPQHVKTTLGNTKDYIAYSVSKVKSTLLKIKGLSRKKKIGLFIILLFIVGVSVLMKKTVTGGWLPHIDRPLLTSFKEEAQHIYSFNRKTDMVNLYQAFPQPKFTVLLDKIIVNLKRKRANTNPMAALEIFLDTDSQETAVEIKDRKLHVLDASQRAVEEFSYNELVSVRGKTKVKSAIRHQINQILNQGRVEKVYIKTWVIKP